MFTPLSPNSRDPETGSRLFACRAGRATALPDDTAPQPEISASAAPRR